MIDWKVVLNLLVSSVGAGVVAGVGSLQAQPVAPWQAHAAVAGAATLSYLAGHLRQSPLPTPPQK